MTIHIAANTGCNLGCEYCYEEPDREMKQKQIDNEYDLDLIFERLEQFKRDRNGAEVPGMHGGEPLLIREEDLEEIFKWIHDNFDGRGTHIQTNGTLLTESHIEMFDKYNVSVGISMDGPAELNDSRLARAGGEDVTENMTERTQDAINTLIEHPSVPVGVIVVVTETNCGSDERLEKLLDWMDWLNRHEVNGHYNPAIPYEGVQEDLSVSPQRLKEIYLRTWEWVKEESYRKWNPMREFQDNLLGLNLTNCVNNKCDVYNAGAAQIIKGDGETTGCGKTWEAVGDGVPFLQGDSTNNEYEETTERYEMLKQIPGPYTEQVMNGEIEDQGGCKGCKYWNTCQGGCPSAGMNYDYRNRVRWCPAIYALYEKIEEDMRTMLPGIRMITDLAWDTEIADDTSKGLVDIKPFAAIRQPTTKAQKGSVIGKPTTDEIGTVFDEVISGRGEIEFDQLVTNYKNEFPEEWLTIDEETSNIHADSDKPERQASEDPQSAD
jgi:uncharacterized protein